MAFVSFRRVRGLDRVSSLLEVHDCAPGNSGLAREQPMGKLPRFCPVLMSISCVDYAFVLVARKEYSAHSRPGRFLSRPHLFAAVLIHWSGCGTPHDEVGAMVDLLQVFDFSLGNRRTSSRVLVRWIVSSK